ncbi:Bro-N domain-containing protein [Turicibacter sanguinis]|nr:Bro-N domain-containing protein [Turicibacter sanguinis]MDB8542826.1 Bro-N domain-containing protein [Turicibacter sanguinis]
MYGTFENPLFLAKDVAERLEIDASKNNNQMLVKVDEDDKRISPLFYKGQVREMWFLTEDGLYEVLIQSRKPITNG